MTKKIDSRLMAKEINRIQEKTNKNGVEIHTLNNKDELDFRVNLGINWSAKGTVSIEEAKQFIKDLQEAVEEAENFKYAGCKPNYDWEK
ncbi:hypothetical protein SAMN00017477_0914 [Peptoniphilus asaccharolyticus DSM 20463]|uniref:Uncharacterized protein n=1 Tax=Peptoniphilus asaccharolyticus DSM 20463 TaxID=573058 RepID=A0A1W1UZT1_PEPAS|nr:hypothetical protein [Peptoniphilus asaccharolyticus]MBL7575408.1 hypothetical protein [Peptoniphilus asaccharolyticus]SMB86566.1 hypothetical protein SAMN00017477_0914 [Peptoniphilus asaccharolyticus DSM 20463]